VLAAGRIDTEDLAVLRVVCEPAEVCAIVDAAYQRQREHSARQRRRVVKDRSRP
jgi:hypothetical protein